MEDGIERMTSCLPLLECKSNATYDKKNDIITLSLFSDNTYLTVKIDNNFKDVCIVKSEVNKPQVSYNYSLLYYVSNSNT